MTTATNILFLGYNRDKTKLIDVLEKHNCNIYQTEEHNFPLNNWDLIISFGYRHILSKQTISKLKCPIINLHISYLPYNRGAHPNFWAFYDSTPHGVTIHEIDEKIDTGPIIFQKQIYFNRDENTFAKTYQRLFYEIEQLFISNIKKILSLTYETRNQTGKGSYHRSCDLPDGINWNDNIIKCINKLKAKNKY